MNFRYMTTEQSKGSINTMLLKGVLFTTEGKNRDPCCLSQILFSSLEFNNDMRYTKLYAHSLCRTAGNDFL